MQVKLSNEASQAVHTLIDLMCNEVLKKLQEMNNKTETDNNHPNHKSSGYKSPYEYWSARINKLIADNVPVEHRNELYKWMKENGYWYSKDTTQEKFKQIFAELSKWIGEKFSDSESDSEIETPF